MSPIELPVWQLLHPESPSPWKLYRREEHACVLLSIRSPIDVVASLSYSRQTTLPEHAARIEANARAITAIPQMLHVLRDPLMSQLGDLAPLAGGAYLVAKLRELAAATGGANG